MQGIHDTSHMRLKFSTGVASQQQSPTTSDAPNVMAFMMHPTSGRDGFIQPKAQGNQTPSLPSSPQPPPPCTCSGTFHTKYDFGCHKLIGRPCVACRTRIGPSITFIDPNNFAVSTTNVMEAGRQMQPFGGFRMGMMHPNSGRDGGFVASDGGIWTNLVHSVAQQTSGRDGGFIQPTQGRSDGKSTFMARTESGRVQFGMAHHTSGRDGTFGGNNSSGSNNTTFGSGTK